MKKITVTKPIKSGRTTYRPGDIEVEDAVADELLKTDSAVPFVAPDHYGPAGFKRKPNRAAKPAPPKPKGDI